MRKSAIAIGMLMIGAFAVTDFTPTAEAATTTASASRKNYTPTSQRRLRSIGYVGDFSDIACHTWLTDDDIYYLSPTELRILRNTIYARHGRKFKDAKLRRYFSNFSWYRPYRSEIPMNELSQTEQHNIMLIQSWE